MLDHVFLCGPSGLQSALGGRMASRLGTSVAVQDGVATIYIDGVLSRAGTWGSSYDTIASQVAEAASDDRVRDILLIINSPGGMAAGVSIAGDAIAAAAQVKRVVAFADGMAASAAYWLASQSTRIIAERMSLVGSLGTYSVMVDSSGSFSQAGIKIHVVKAGEFKGLGVLGTEVTDSQRAEVQRLVNALNEHFLSAVASGRHLSLEAVRQLADGRGHLSADAAKLRLIDAVGTLDEVLTALHRTVLNAEQRWQAAVEAKQATGLDQRQAVRAVVGENPTLHREYVASANRS